jgi:two-component system nitrate/nitrite response regulator NarL
LLIEGLKHLLDQDFILTDHLIAVSEGVTLPDADLFIVEASGDEVLRTIRMIRGRKPDSRIACFESAELPRLLGRVLQAGSSGILGRDLSAKTFCQSLRLVMVGEVVLPADLVSRFLEKPTTISNAPEVESDEDLSGDDAVCLRDARLTSRELDILKWLAGGAPNKVIAERLGITGGTVKAHLKNLQRKINVTNRTQAALWAVHNRLENLTDEIRSIA